MKNVVKSLIVAGAMIAAGSATAGMMDEISPYVGVDYNHSMMKFKNDGESDGYYQGSVPKSYDGATIYLGTKFHENFGLELGYDWFANEKKKGSFEDDNDNIVEGVTLKVSRKSAYLDMVGFLPVMDKLSLVASLGYGWVKPKIEITGDGFSAKVDLKSKGVARVAVGANYMLTDMVGLRARLGWENTSRLRAEGEKLFKDATNVRIGAFVKF